MIKIVFIYSDDDRICGFSAEGHSGAGRKGRDIVCSAVSALILTTILGITECLRITAVLEQEEGYTYFCLPSGLSADLESKGELLLMSLEKGISAIALKYPKNVRVTRKILPSVGFPWHFSDQDYLKKGDDNMANEVESVEMEKPVTTSNPYTFEKVLGVALLGAITGVILYYAYNHLSEESKKTVKDTIVTQVKTQVRKIISE